MCEFRLKVCSVIVLVFYGCCFCLLKVTYADTLNTVCPSSVNETSALCISGNRWHLWTSSDCEAADCCWVQYNGRPACYQKECATGYFGSYCQFRCECLDGISCDRVTGECPHGCREDLWGVGCLLDSDCTYNDGIGASYMGKKYKTSNNRVCMNWTQQRPYTGPQFPDANLISAGNYCRNPKRNNRNTEGRTWCYWRLDSRPRWDYCVLKNCSCPLGRFDVNCRNECHCRDANENCDQSAGWCSTGCHDHWTGPTCQECANGYFGSRCQYVCHCSDAYEACDKSSGECHSGCAHGWNGTGCQRACAMGYFGLNCETACNCQSPTEICNKSTGDCPSSGCKSGYGGPGCLTALPVMTRLPWVDAKNASSIVVKWRPWGPPVDKGSGPVVAYIVTYRPSHGGNWTESRQTNGRLMAIVGLLKDHNYQFRVSPVHQIGVVGIASPTLTAATCGNPLSGPVMINMKVTAGDDDAVDQEDLLLLPTHKNISLIVDWKYPPRDKYNCISIRSSKVYVRSAATGGQFKLERRSYVQRTQVDSVDPYSNLTVGISLENNAELESPIAEKLYVGKSGPVTELTALAKSATEIHVQWSPPLRSNGIISCYLMSYREIRLGACSEAPEEWSPLTDIDADRNEWEFSDLEPYSKYEVRVIPKTNAGKGQVSSIFIETEEAMPGNITGLEVAYITSTSVKLQWTAMNCRSQNGSHAGYAYELIRTSDALPVVVAMARQNGTSVELPNLVPFTSYTFEIAFTNRRFVGSKASVNFVTLEDVPPEPQDLALLSRLSHSLSISWQPPEPPHGIIRGYTVAYHQQDAPSLQMSYVSLEASELSYTVTQLTPFTTYVIQVRAHTLVGDGSWAIVNGTTDESIPSEPLNFVNVSRTSKSLSFHWLEPLHPNGVIVSYQISCKPNSRYNRHSHDLGRKEESVKSREFSINNLHPGVCYVCSVNASTSKGIGPSATRLVWTEPDASQIISGPKVELLKSEYVTIALQLQPAQTDDNMEETDNLYRIVIEQLLPPSPYENRRTRRESSQEPCGLSHTHLVDYSRASQNKLNCYVAAELALVAPDEVFIVGDSKTYGGFYNAPLVRNIGHKIWFGMVVTVDGAAASSYAVTEASPLDAKDSVSPPLSIVRSPDSQPMIAGIIVGVLLVILIVIVVMVIIFCKRVKSRQKQYANNSIIRFQNIPHTNSGTLENCDGDDISEGRTEVLPLCPDRSPAGTLECRQPVRVDDLWGYVAAKKLAHESSLDDEYKNLPQGLLFPCDVAKRPENRPCNRYANIIAYDHSRVILERTDGLGTDYINGNYIDGYRQPGAFIATQGPSKHTINDIWRMTWQLKSTRIVMLANLIEDGRRKCEQYWPVSGSATYDGITVELLDTEEYADFKVRSFVLSKGASDILKVKQLHFTAWPDHGVPFQPTSLLSFHRKFHSYDDRAPCSPAIVHCSAGVGRTGTFIALCYLLEQAKAENVVDVFGCVRQLRQSRVNMIQTKEQYVFVYDALLEALTTGETSVPSCEFRERYIELKKVNPTTGKSGCRAEFEMLSNVTSQGRDVDVAKLDGLKPENVHKNRDTSIMPMNKFSRPYLLTCNNGSSDYINAVFIDGYKQRDAFIVTQMPLNNTIIDFWTMVFDHSCHTIVMINELDMTDKGVGLYFPLSFSTQTHGPFTVELVALDNRTNPDIIVRDFHLSFKRQPSSAPILIRHFQFLPFSCRDAVPRSRSAMLSLLGMLEAWQQRSGNSSIVVHCMDGATRCGLICALSYLVERLKVEQDVDVFQSVKHVRINRPQLVPTYEQYEFLYDMAVEYLDCFETYSNFK